MIKKKYVSRLYRKQPHITLNRARVLRPVVDYLRNSNGRKEGEPKGDGAWSIVKGAGNAQLALLRRKVSEQVAARSVACTIDVVVGLGHEHGGGGGVSSSLGDGIHRSDHGISRGEDSTHGVVSVSGGAAGDGGVPVPAVRGDGVAGVQSTLGGGSLGEGSSGAEVTRARIGEGHVVGGRALPFVLPLLGNLILCTIVGLPFCREMKNTVFSTRPTNCCALNNWPTN